MYIVILQKNYNLYKNSHVKYEDVWITYKNIIWRGCVVIKVYGAASSFAPTLTVPSTFTFTELSQSGVPWCKTVLDTNLAIVFGHELNELSGKEEVKRRWRGHE